MAGRILNRRELRRQADQAEQPVAVPGDTTAAAVSPEKKAKGKASAGSKAKKSRAKKAPSRMRACWGIFDSGMKQVAVFDYNRRAAAEEKLAELLARKKGLQFLQIVKEPMPEAAPLAAAPGT
jgi:hypothetical protein